MLQSITGLLKFAIHAEDGEIGHIDDACFDDAGWTIRYVVVRAGIWPLGRQKLISPASIRRVDWASHRISVALTCEQVRTSPDVETNKPVSRQHEADLSAYYGWPQYWDFVSVGLEPLPALPLPNPPLKESQGDPHLRSAHEVKGYHIATQDGFVVGHVSDFVFDDQTWVVRFIVVDAGRWLHHRFLLLKPEWIETIAWEDRHVTVELTKEAIETSPEFVPVFPLSAEYADRLIRHYN